MNGIHKLFFFSSSILKIYLKVFSNIWYMDVTLTPTLTLITWLDERSVDIFQFLTLNFDVNSQLAWSSIVVQYTGGKKRNEINHNSNGNKTHLFFLLSWHKLMSFNFLEHFPFLMNVFKLSAVIRKLWKHDWTWKINAIH